jgi:8-oxo-dGTP diphosphatase
VWPYGVDLFGSILMLKERIGFAWKILPPWVRLRIIRATQHKFTVSAAAIVTDGDGKVLLLNHVLRPSSGWGLPGGFVEKGEQPEAAIRRELREETGIDLDDPKMFRVRTLGPHIEMLFVARALGEASIKSREITDLGWFDIESMPEEMNQGQKGLIREVFAQAEA